jgi:hypothetical protein
MSALGQKQTCALQNVMSALPPKADMCGATSDVRFGPKADVVGQRMHAIRAERVKGWFNGRPRHRFRPNP